MDGGRRHVRFGRVPAVAEHHAQRVGAGTQRLGQVVGHVQDSGAEREGLIVVVVGVGRVEYVVADPGAVAGQLVVAETGDVAARAAHRSGERQLAAEQGRRHAFGPGDPAAAPFIARQQPRLEAGRSAEGRGRAALVPAAHGPEAARAGIQRRAAVTHPGVTFLHAAGVPQVGGARHQPVGRAGDQHLVRGLPGAARRRPPAPGEPRRGLIDGERIDRVAAAKIGGGHGAVTPRVVTLGMREPCHTGSPHAVLEASCNRFPIDWSCSPSTTAAGPTSSWWARCLRGTASAPPSTSPRGWGSRTRAGSWTGTRSGGCTTPASRSATTTAGTLRSTRRRGRSSSAICATWRRAAPRTAFPSRSPTATRAAITAARPWRRCTARGTCSRAAAPRPSTSITRRAPTAAPTPRTRIIRC